MKTLNRIKADTRIKDAWNEGEDGYWVMAKNGWSFDFYGDNSHTIHEWNTKDLLRQFRTIRPCTCSECVQMLAKGVA